MVRCLVLLLMVLSLSGCASMYRPSSDLESDVLFRSKRDVSPGDFRSAKIQMGSVEVAWAGVILDSKVSDAGDHYNIELEVQHHYFDWIEDNHHFHLSIRSDGRINTKWSLGRALTREAIANEMKRGRMIIIYGFPESMASDSLVVKATYLRTFSPEVFQIETMDYGRPVETINLLKWWGIL